MFKLLSGMKGVNKFDYLWLLMSHIYWVEQLGHGLTAVYISKQS